MGSFKSKGPRKSPGQDSRSFGRKPAGKRESIKDKREARGLREDAGKPSKRLEPRRNFGMKDNRKGPMRRFGESKAGPQDRPRSYSRPREEPREGQRTTFSRSNEGTNGPKRTFSRSNDGPRTYGRPSEGSRNGPRSYNKPRTYGRPSEGFKDRQRSYDRPKEDSPRTERRGRNMSNRAQALKDTSQGFRKFSREPSQKTQKQRRDYQVVCANCGKQTDVPFKPTGIKPVYCSECFKKKRD